MKVEKVAIVFGASGLVGSNLVKELIKSPGYNQIILVVRKALVVADPKVHEISLEKYEAFDFTKISPAETHVFCCLGTTIKKAGTKEAFRKVDYELPINIASWAKSKEIETFAVISSIGANSQSSNFYLKTKGEMEDGIRRLEFTNTVIVRPSLLLGTRNEFRLGEELAKMFSGVLKLFLSGSLKKYRPIAAHTVARAMLILANSHEKDIIFESDRLVAVATKKQI